MYMLLIPNILLVEMIKVNFLLAMRGAQQLEEIALELVAVVVDVFFGIFAHEQHLPNVGLGLSMHFEAIFVPAL